MILHVVRSHYDIIRSFGSFVCVALIWTSRKIIPLESIFFSEITGPPLKNVPPKGLFVEVERIAVVQSVYESSEVS